jgi:hypothetical protein
MFPEAEIETHRANTRFYQDTVENIRGCSTATQYAPEASCRQSRK